MKLWRVTGVVMGSKYLGEFSAETKEEAQVMALESKAASVNLCHQCSCQAEDGRIEEAIAEEIV